MSRETGPGIPSEELGKKAGKVKSEEAVASLEEAFGESTDEDELLLIPGVKKGKDWDKMKEHLRKKQERENSDNKEAIR